MRKPLAHKGSATWRSTASTADCPDQTARNRLRVTYPAKPKPAKPSAIIAQVATSGIAEMLKVWLPLLSGYYESQ